MHKKFFTKTVRFMSSRNFYRKISLCITLIALAGFMLLSNDADATTITINANSPGTYWNQWVDTGLDLMPGDILSISAEGEAKTTSSGPSYLPDGANPAQIPNQTESLVNSVNLGSLVGMIDSPSGNIPSYPTFNTEGMYLLDDGIGGSLFGPGFVGSSFTQIVPVNVTGRLYLGFNDGFDADNSGNYIATINITSPVPEPATMLLLGSGLFGLAGFRKKFWKN